MKNDIPNFLLLWSLNTGKESMFEFVYTPSEFLSFLQSDFVLTTNKDFEFALMALGSLRQALYQDLREQHVFGMLTDEAKRLSILEGESIASKSLDRESLIEDMDLSHFLEIYQNFKEIQAKVVQISSLR